MVRITVSAEMNVVIQDPMPAEGKLSMTVAAGTTDSFDITNAQFNRLGDQLVALEGIGALTYVVTAIPDEDTRTQDADLDGLPTISKLGQATIDHDGEQGVTLQGMNVVAYQGIAQYLFADSTDPLNVDKQILIQSATAGLSGNLLDVEIIDSLGGGLTIAVTPVPTTGRTEITIDVGGAASTYGQIDTAINDPAATCLGVISSTLPGAGTGVAEVAALTALAGGDGMGMSLMLCDEPCTIRSIDLGAVPGTDPQVITFDSPDLNGIAATGELTNLVLRSGAKIAHITVPMA